MDEGYQANIQAPLLPRLYAASSSPPKRSPRYQPRPVQPRRELDLDSLRNAKLQRGCMSERHLDAQGVLRLMRFAPTTLAPGAVFKVLRQQGLDESDAFERRGPQADSPERKGRSPGRRKGRSPRKRSPMGQSPNASPRNQSPDFTELLRMEAELWQNSTFKWLTECERHGERFAAVSQDLEDWISRAEALMPADDMQDRDGQGLLSPELVASAKTVLALKMEAEKQEKGKTLENLVSRLYVVRDNGNSGLTNTGGSTMGEMNLKLQTCHGKEVTSPKTIVTKAKDFRAALVKIYGDYSHAWDQMDTNENGLLDIREFGTACFKLHLTGSVKSIFKEMSHDGTNLRLTDLDPSLRQEQERREQEKLKKLQERSLARQSTTRLPVLDRLAIQTESSTQSLSPKEDDKGANSKRRPSNRVTLTTGEVHYALAHQSCHDGKPTLNSSKDFLQALMRKFPSLEEAWDQLDSNSNGVIDFQEFVLACRKIQVRGNMHEMFSALCADESTGLKMHDLVCSPKMKDEQERREQAHQEWKRIHHEQIQEHEREAQKLWRTNTNKSLASQTPRGSTLSTTQTIPHLSDGIAFGHAPSTVLE